MQLALLYRRCRKRVDVINWEGFVFVFYMGLDYFKETPRVYTIYLNVILLELERVSITGLVN